MTGHSQKLNGHWGKLNITENCLDCHVETHPDKLALIWEPNDPNDATVQYTYQELLTAVSRFANGLKNQGIKKGTGCVLHAHDT